jgi:rubrerythrin
MTEKLAGATVWEQELYDHLASHVEQERGLLWSYQAAAEVSESPTFRYLASMIEEDEKRHDQLFRELCEALKIDAELRPEEPEIPRLDHWGPHPEQIVEITEQLLHREREDAKEMRRLARELDSYKETTLWHLLVRLVEADTAKHIEILEFVARHARPVGE